MSVDLPAPFWPSRKCTSPACTVSETRSSARTPGKALEIARISRIGATTRLLSRWRLRRFRQPEGRFRRQARGDDLRPAGWPRHLDAIDRRGLTEAEVQRHGALGKIAGLSVVPLRQHAASRRHAHRGPEAVAVGRVPTSETP